MRQFINIVGGIAYGITPILGASLFGLFIYDVLPNSIGIGIIGFLGILSLYLGYSIFKKIQIIGPFEFMAAKHATPDLDNLKLSTDSSTKVRMPEEFVELISEKRNLFKGGALRLYNDWFGKPYDNVHLIEKGFYDSETKILTLELDQGERLEIYNPIHIRESSAFLKIKNADRIKLIWFYYGKPQTEENQYFIDYHKTNNKIETNTNVDWYKPVFDVSLGSPALMIYGK
ncbi:hypothetical protein [Aestuariivivens insulae]|uniref:hypothetical protein n=1 Tax=Aestuariivivens insulae TaxID=1621988 RepID=UPI001F58257C|nr:hypothetical protein [Aestuariivivens insulae]